jgi:hypothetical protein
MASTQRRISAWTRRSTSDTQSDYRFFAEFRHVGACASVPVALMPPRVSPVGRRLCRGHRGNLAYGARPDKHRASWRTTPPPLRDRCRTQRRATPSAIEQFTGHKAGGIGSTSAAGLPADRGMRSVVVVPTSISRAVPDGAYRPAKVANANQLAEAVWCHSSRAVFASTKRPAVVQTSSRSVPNTSAAAERMCVTPCRLLGSNRAIRRVIVSATRCPSGNRATIFRSSSAKRSG